MSFWKKEEKEFNWDDLPQTEPQPPEQPPSLDLGNPLQKQEPSFNKNEFQNQFDLINSKLDTIKAILDSINQRISKLENKNEEPKNRLW
jgi:hypothetical protein